MRLSLCVYKCVGVSVCDHGESSGASALASEIENNSKAVSTATVKYCERRVVVATAGAPAGER